MSLFEEGDEKGKLKQVISKEVEVSKSELVDINKLLEESLGAS